MTKEEIKRNIESSIKSFSKNNLSINCINLFNCLGYITDRQAPLLEKTYSEFKENFIVPNSKFNEEKALCTEWKYIDLLFQLSKEEIQKSISLFDTKIVDNTVIETYLFFTIELSKENYSRSELSNITREINKLFPMPAMIIFRYGKYITISIINRRLHKKNENKDVLEKVTLIKDILIPSKNEEITHRAHIEILFDLSFEELKKKYELTNFIELHYAWQKTLDTKELNKRFFKELANWYFWAIDIIEFPDDLEKNKVVRNSINLIRLITRVVFIWFIKEKTLVPDSLFNKNFLNDLIKDFNKTDKSKNYYLAIMQNLFFGTLNQKIVDRKFVKDNDYLSNKKEYGVKNLFRYTDLFKKTEKQVLEIFNEIPFLNGGLFDCLDKIDENGKIIYVDGFSRNIKKQTIIPDYLFFSDEKNIDLNHVYGTKEKVHKTKGLFNLLNSYKFTVCENTPVEEEIALDPELLGKVFENLLASYNPETQTTARKQTGSFYTPREIVNYMVDESLLEYLKQKSNNYSQEFEQRLRDVFSYSEKQIQFNKSEIKTIIESIYKCKILDPACGSGAFPMGILLKMVYVLQRLDKDNKHWRFLQVQKVIEETKEAYEIGNKEDRTKRLTEINDVFENNTSDYGRKLFLIENCIYGVDIQPVAVQIAKLRFFISLIIDQIKQESINNFGIRSLPNLETKFVAANTLIELEKPVQEKIRNSHIEDKENELKEIRHLYFTANTRRKKLNYQEKDKILRKEIAALLINDGWDNNTAQQIISFDPYDQNNSTTWFDAEWMFGLDRGFDIIIGNPPYISIRTKEFDESLKVYFKKHYSLAVGQFDVFVLFIEKSKRILNKNGILSFIVPKRLLTNENFEHVRKFIRKNLPISIYVDAQIPFESASVEANVLISSNNESREIKTFIYNGDTINYKFSLEREIIELMPFNIFPFSVNSKKINLVYQILKNSNNILGNYVTIIRGLECGFNNNSISRNKSNYKIIKGEHISKYYVKDTDYYLNIELLANKLLKPQEIFLKTPKLLIKFISNSLDIAYDDYGYYNTNVVYNVHPKPGYENYLKYFLALGNSNIINFWFLNTYVNDDKIFPHIQKNQLESIPVILSEKVYILNNLVDYVIIKRKSKMDSSYFERIIDAVIYELYLPNAIESSEAGIIKYLYNLPNITNFDVKMSHKTIDAVYEKLSSPNHPISASLLKLINIEEIKIIEELV